MILSLFALPFAAFGGGIMFWHARNVGSLLRTRDHGQERNATITEHAISNVSINNVHQQHLVWLDDAGQTGRSMIISPTHIQDFPVGSQITVYSDPTLGKSVWQGDVGPARAYRAVTGTNTDNAAPKTKPVNEPAIRRIR